LVVCPTHYARACATRRCCRFVDEINPTAGCPVYDDIEENVGMTEAINYESSPEESNTNTNTTNTSTLTSSSMEIYTQREEEEEAEGETPRDEEEGAAYAEPELGAINV